MAAPLVKTKTPGIYKRGSRYVVAYRLNGTQRRETVRTWEAAVKLKRARETDRDRGELQEETRLGFRAYAEEWVERYQGTGRRGFREDTRDDYRRDLKAYAYPFLDERLGRTLGQLTTRDLANFVAWLCEQNKGRSGKPLADASVRRIFAPVRACLATAAREGLIRHNPSREVTLPHRARVEEDEDQEVRALSRDELATVLVVAHSDHRVFLEVLAATGLRWSEAIALRPRDLVLDGSTPVAKVRRRLVRGKFGPPKSRHGRRDVPLPFSVVQGLRHLTVGVAADDLVFRSTRGGGPLDHSDMLRRVLRPAAEEAGAGWAGFHTFRHTFASLHLARGTSIVAVSRLLGHHSASFTLERYAHLIPGDETPALDLSVELTGGNAGVNVPTPTDADVAAVVIPDLAVEPAIC